MEVSIYGIVSIYENPERFKLSEEALAAMATAKLPGSLMTKLRTLKDKDFGSRQGFVSILAATLDKAERKNFQDLILAYARYNTSGVNPKKK